MTISRTDLKLSPMKGKSLKEQILFGVPQGSILGPLLFLIHDNDFHQQIQKSDIIMYADDTILLFSEKN